MVQYCFVKDSSANTMHLKHLQLHLFIYQHQTTEILLSILMPEFCLFLCTGNRNILKCLPRELSRNPTNILAVILGGILIIFPSRDFTTLLFEYLVRKMRPGSAPALSLIRYHPHLIFATCNQSPLISYKQEKIIVLCAGLCKYLQGLIEVDCKMMARR